MGVSGRVNLDGRTFSASSSAARSGREKESANAGESAQCHIDFRSGLTDDISNELWLNPNRADGRQSRLECLKATPQPETLPHKVSLLSTLAGRPENYVALGETACATNAICQPPGTDTNEKPPPPWGRPSFFVVCQAAQQPGCRA